MERADLWAAFKERGCERAREALILAHLRYVPLTLKRAVPNVPVGIDRDDLESEAMMAVVRAIDRYNPARGVSSSSWVITSIRFRLREYLREQDWVPRSVRRKEQQGEETPISIVSLDVPVLTAAGEETPLGELIPDPAPPLFARLVEEWQETMALGLINWLPRRERAVMQRRCREGERFYQIAAALEMDVRTVESLHAAAIQRLQQLVRRQGLFADAA